MSTEATAHNHALTERLFSACPAYSRVLDLLPLGWSAQPFKWGIVHYDAGSSSGIMQTSQLAALSNFARSKQKLSVSRQLFPRRAVMARSKYQRLTLCI